MIMGTKITKGQGGQSIAVLDLVMWRISRAAAAMHAPRAPRRRAPAPASIAMLLQLRGW